MSNNIYINEVVYNISAISNKISIVDDSLDVVEISVDDRVIINDGESTIISVGIQGPAGISGVNDMFYEYAVNDVDDAGSGITYICMSKSNASTWLVKKVTEVSNDIDIKYANISNNPSVTTYTQAYTARATLTYSDIGDIII